MWTKIDFYHIFSFEKYFKVLIQKNDKFINKRITKKCDSLTNFNNKWST